MAREYRYKLHSVPEARNDGTKGVGHDIEAVYREEGTEDEWQPVPEHHVAGLSILGDEILTVMETGTNPEKVTAYKDLIRAALDASGFLPVFDKGWEEEQLEAFMANNDIAIEAAAAVEQFITVDIGQEFPIYFRL